MDHSPCSWFEVFEEMLTVKANCRGKQLLKKFLPVVLASFGSLANGIYRSYTVKVTERLTVCA